MPYKDASKQKEYQKQWYLNNKVQAKESAQSAWKKKVKWLQELKEASPCIDCDLFWPYYVMQFDHTTNNKIAGISKMLRNCSIEQVKAEIAKCELVCSNCHAIRTHVRMQLLTEVEESASLDES